jgi:hypothetical protein
MGPLGPEPPFLGQGIQCWGSRCGWVPAQDDIYLGKKTISLSFNLRCKCWLCGCSLAHSPPSRSWLA